MVSENAEPKELKELKEIVSYEDILFALAGNEHVERAVKVTAMNPSLSLAIIGHKGQDLPFITKRIRALYERVGAKARARHYYPCPCGFLLNPRYVCGCTETEVNGHLAHSIQAMYREHLYIEVLDPSFDEALAVMLPNDDKLWALLDEIRGGLERNLPYVKWDWLPLDAQTLLHDAYDKLRFNQYDLKQVMNITSAIMRLDNVLKPGVPQVAEAIQYRHNPLLKLLENNESGVLSK